MMDRNSTIFSLRSESAMYVLGSHDANFANDVTLFPGILRY